MEPVPAQNILGKLLHPRGVLVSQLINAFHYLVSPGSQSESPA
jgi:hypothetical protein